MARSLADRQRAHEQQKARLAEQEAKIKLAERKARTKRLIEAGATAVVPGRLLQARITATTDDHLIAEPA